MQVLGVQSSAQSEGYSVLHPCTGDHPLRNHARKPRAGAAVTQDAPPPQPPPPPLMLHAKKVKQDVLSSQVDEISSMGKKSEELE